MRRRRTNIDKQEALVSALWGFIRANNIALQNGWPMITAGIEATQVNDSAMRKAVSTIMDTFGYDVSEK